MACDPQQSRFPGEETYGPSKPIGFTPSGGSQHFDLSFMMPAYEAMAFPRLTALSMRCQFTNVAVTDGPYPADKLLKIFDHLYVRDSDSVRYDVTGMGHRLIEYRERLNPQFDVDVANGDDLEFWIHFPVVPKRFPAPQKCRWELEKLLRGQITVGMVGGVIAANDGALNDPTIDVTDAQDGTLELWADIVDEGVDESKTRIVYREFPLNNNYDNFPIEGRPRYIDQYIGQDAPGADQWAQGQNITSRVLRMNATVASKLIDKYLYEVAPMRDRSNETPNSDDPVLQGKVVPVFTLRDGQGMTESPEISSLDFRTDSVFDSGEFLGTSQPSLVACWIEDRPDNACETGGVFKGANGKSYAMDEVAPDLRAKMPVVGGTGKRIRRATMSVRQ